ncbi:MAG: hypothetical protein JWO57_1182 [Pseudonocardiales bacterium]|nr:hypothetical protein [Pseudonocardiales bacterium]
MRTRYLAIAAVVTILAPACTSGASTVIASPTPPGSSAPSSPLTSPTSLSSLSSPPVEPSPTRTGPLVTGPGVQPGEKPPTLPAEAKHHTPAGALSFAEYYFKALDWSTATNDPYLVEQISRRTCQACRRVINSLDDLRAKGQRLLGGRITLVSAKLVTGTFRFRAEHVVQAALTEESEVLTRPSNVPSTVAPPSNATSLVFVSHKESGWEVVEVGAPS